MFPVAAAFGNPPAGAASGYTIANSCRFNDNDSASLSRTSGAPTSQRLATYSFWTKRGNLGITTKAFSFAFSTGIGFNSSDQLSIIIDNGSGEIQTNSVYRDPASWYHFVVAIDTTQATGADRVKIYVNGVEYSGTYNRQTIITQNTDISSFAASKTWYIGRLDYQAVQYYDGYLAEVVFVDGQALDPTSFGNFNANGVWVPIDVSGLTFGNNGFYLDFADSFDIGNDVSGNANDFTPSGLAAEDIVIDTPTNNYATLMSNNKNTNVTMTDGNLVNDNNAAASYSGSRVSIGVPLGFKVYIEAKCLDAGGGGAFGMYPSYKDIRGDTDPGQQSDEYVILNNGESVRVTRNNGVNTNTRTNDALDDIWQIAFDSSTGDLWLGRNSTWFGGGDPALGTTPTYSGLSTTEQWTIGLWASSNSGGKYQLVAGSGGTTGLTYDSDAGGYFDQTPPTGFLALCTANLGTPTIADPSAHFDVALYTGNGTAIGSGGNEISDLSFQPDLVWIKNRDAADSHIVTDAVRGATNYLQFEGTDAQITDAESLSSFDADGFTLGNNVEVNTNTEDYVAWCWKGDGTSGGATNSDGATSTNVNVNTTAGFSIVAWTSPLSATTLGHGLGVAPKVIFGATEYDGSMSPRFYHEDVGNGYYMLTTDTGARTATSDWNSTSPTSTVFSVSNRFNTSGSYIAYCFAEIEGFSKFGTYVANANADGPFIWCGFRPALVICKEYLAAGSWYVFDKKRIGYNVDNDSLKIESTAAEATTDYVDLLSNGFKFRSTAGPNSAGSYVFMAFAEHPFAYARAR